MYLVEEEQVGSVRLYGKMVPFPELQQLSHRDVRNLVCGWIAREEQPKVDDALADITHVDIPHGQNEQILAQTRAARKDGILYTGSAPKDWSNIDWEIDRYALQLCVGGRYGHPLRIIHSRRGYLGEIWTCDEFTVPDNCEGDIIKRNNYENRGMWDEELKMFERYPDYPQKDEHQQKK